MGIGYSVKQRSFASGTASDALRIAFFLPHLRHGGVEKVCTTLIRNLSRDRFAPFVILQQRDGEFLEILGDTPVLELRRRRAPLCIAELAWLLRKQRADIVYTATTATNIYAALAAKMAGCRSVISEHTPLAGNLAESKWRGLRRAGIRCAYPFADLSVAPLPRIGEELAELLGSRRPAFSALPNPVVDAVMPEAPVPNLALRLASIGRLADVKRFDLMIDAFALVRAQLPEASLTIFGDGPARAALEAQIGRLGLDDAVALPGFAPDVTERIKASDMFICSSRREGFGNAIVEAMAAGVPVVSVDCPVGPEVLLDGGSAGRLVRDHTPAALSHAIVEVAKDQPLRQTYAAAGLRVANKFSVPAAVSAYEQAFSTLSG